MIISKNKIIFLNNKLTNHSNALDCLLPDKGHHPLALNLDLSASTWGGVSHGRAITSPFKPLASMGPIRFGVALSKLKRFLPFVRYVTSLIMGVS